jgi:cholesterol transport system auxiliary component
MLMSRLIHRSSLPLSRRPFSSGAAAVLLAFGVLAAGCAGTPAPLADIRYDFGPPAAASSAASLPAVKVLEVTAPPMLESDRLIYRLSYADAQQTASYANSHWTMMPSQLLTQRLRGALSEHGTVLTGADGVSAPVLKVDLTEFEQVFDSQTESHAAISARATITRSGKVIGQRTFAARAPAKSADAAGGAQALAAASDDLVAQVSAWLVAQPLVAAQ